MEALFLKPLWDSLALVLYPHPVTFFSIAFNQWLKNLECILVDYQLKDIACFTQLADKAKMELGSLQLNVL